MSSEDSVTVSLDVKLNSFENNVLKEYENYSTRKKQEALGNACLLLQLL